MIPSDKTGAITLRDKNRHRLFERVVQQVVGHGAERLITVRVAECRRGYEAVIIVGFCPADQAAVDRKATWMW